MSEARQIILEAARTLGSRLACKRRVGDDKAYTDVVLSRLHADNLIWPMALCEEGQQRPSLIDCARLNFHVARVSGSAGLIYAMHLSQAFTLLRHSGANTFLRDFQARAIRDQALVASGTSEKGVGGDIFTSLCTLEEAEGGWYRLSKKSPNISYLDKAGALLVTAMQPQPSGRPMQVLIAADKADIQAEAGDGGGFIGMNGIVNHPYDLTIRFQRAAIFPERYPVIASATMTPTIHVFWASLWSGIARNILDRTRSYLVKEASEKDEASKVMWFAFSQLVDQHCCMNAFIRDTIHHYDAVSEGGAGGAPNLAQTARVKRLKVVCSELLSKISEGALSLVGMRGYLESGPYSLSEPIRDAMSAKVMISNFRLSAGNADIERYVSEEL